MNQAIPGLSPDRFAEMSVDQLAGTFKLLHDLAKP